MGTVQYGTVRYSTVLYLTVLFSKVLYGNQCFILFFKETMETRACKALTALVSMGNPLTIYWFYWSH